MVQQWQCDGLNDCWWFVVVVVVLWLLFGRRCGAAGCVFLLLLLLLLVLFVSSVVVRRAILGRGISRSVTVVRYRCGGITGAGILRGVVVLFLHVVVVVVDARFGCHDVVELRRRRIIGLVLV